MKEIYNGLVFLSILWASHQIETQSVPQELIWLWDEKDIWLIWTQIAVVSPEYTEETLIALLTLAIVQSEKNTFPKMQFTLKCGAKPSWIPAFLLLLLYYYYLCICLFIYLLFHKLKRGMLWEMIHFAKSNCSFSYFLSYMQQICQGPLTS